MKWFLPWRFDEISFLFKLWSELNCFLSYIDHSQWLLCSSVMWPCRWYKLLKCQDWMQIPWKSFYPPKNPFQAGSNSVNLRRWKSIFIDAGFWHSVRVRILSEVNSILQIWEVKHPFQEVDWILWTSECKNPFQGGSQSVNLRRYKSLPTWIDFCEIWEGKIYVYRCWILA